MMRQAFVLFLVLITFSLAFAGCQYESPTSTPESSSTVRQTTSLAVSSSVVTPPILTSIPSAIQPSLTSTPSITSSPGTELIFETIVKPLNAGGTYEGTNAQIRVISSKQPPLPEELRWIHSEYQTKILAVDFSQYFEVLVFNGFRGGFISYLNVQKIYQNSDVIFVIAHLDDLQPAATALLAYTSQYQVVKISRSQITQPGAITFKLIDETGHERANTTATDLAGNK